jgi:hypothetical protein
MQAIACTFKISAVEREVKMRALIAARKLTTTVKSSTQSST